MKIKKGLLLNCVFAVLAAAFILTLQFKGALTHMELTALDLSYLLRGSLQYHPRINIIEISDADIEKVGRWPWPRRWLAAMAGALSGLGARSIYFDIILSEPSDEAEDALLEEAITAAGNVYLPFVFQRGSPEAEGAIYPIKRFSSHLKGTGAINIYPDLDGTIRRIPLVFNAPGGPVYHAALRVAMDYDRLDPVGVSAGRLLLRGQNANQVFIPVSDEGSMLISWSGKWQDTFRHYSFLEVLSAYKSYLDGKPSAINPADFKDSICLVGMTAVGLYDIKPVPIQPEFPGVGIIANAISNILQRRFVYVLPLWAGILALLLLSLCPALAISGERPGREALVVLAVAAGYYLLHILLFRYGVSLPATMPVLGLALSSAAIGTYNFVSVSLEKQRFAKLSNVDELTGLFNIRYFRNLLEPQMRAASGGKPADFSVAMCDIDRFKQFNDTYGHQVGDLVLREVARSLKGSVRNSDVVARYGGEELIVLLRGARLQEALSIGEKMRQAVQEAHVMDASNKYSVTISIGVAAYKSGDDYDTLVKRADDALYKAKALGRNCVSHIAADFVRLSPAGENP